MTFKIHAKRGVDLRVLLLTGLKNTRLDLRGLYVGSILKLKKQKLTFLKQTNYIPIRFEKKMLVGINYKLSAVTSYGLLWDTLHYKIISVGERQQLRGRK